MQQTQSRDEQRYKHTLDAAITIYRTEGWRAFFRGLFPSLLGITHVAIQFPLYEFLKGWASEYILSVPQIIILTWPMAPFRRRRARKTNSIPDPWLFITGEDDGVDRDVSPRGVADTITDVSASEGGICRHTWPCAWRDSHGEDHHT